MTRSVKSVRRPISNLISNYNFESVPAFTASTTGVNIWIDGTATGTSSSGENYSWGVAGSVGTGSIKYDTVTKYSGSGSLKISLTATGSLKNAANLPGATAGNIIRWGYKLLPSTSYTFGGWVKTDITSGTATAGVRLYMNLYIGSGAFSATKTAATGIITTQDWTYYETTFTTSATQLLGIVVMESKGNDGTATLIGDAWFDNLTLTPTTPITRTAITQPTRQPISNLVRNGDFEYAPTFTAATNTTIRWIDGTASGTTQTSPIYGWGTISSGVNAPAQFDTVQKHSGSISMKGSINLSGANTLTIANAKSTTLADIRAGCIPVLPSTSYTFSGWIKTNLISGSATNGAQFICSERKADGSQNVANTIGQVVTTIDWTQYTITFTTGAATTHVMIKCNMVSDGASTLVMDAWFDDIVLTPTTPIARTVV